MMKPNQFALFCLLLVSSSSCLEENKPSIFLEPDNLKIRYEGRIGITDSVAELYWPGSQIEINFKGSAIKALFRDTKGNNYYNIILNDDTSWLFKPDTLFAEYILAEGLENKAHNLKIYKRTEFNRGTTWFYGFKINPGAEFLLPPARKSRKMEFYGNSITAGYAIEDTSGQDRPGGTFTNIYKTYAAITARYFNAESHFIVRSGIGVMASYVPQIMPEIYDLTNPHDPDSHWNFNLFQPDIIVVNLLQNDSWLVNSPHRKEFQLRFDEDAVIDEDFIVEAYARFIEALRDKYAASSIICMLGNMSITKEESPWPAYVERAVRLMNDSKIYTFFVPCKNTGQHPGIEEQKDLANKLIRFIDKNIDW